MECKLNITTNTINFELDRDEVASLYKLLSKLPEEIIDGRCGLTFSEQFFISDLTDQLYDLLK